MSNGVVPASANADVQPDSATLPKKPTIASDAHTGTRSVSRMNRAATPHAPISGGVMRGALRGGGIGVRTRAPIAQTIVPAIPASANSQMTYTGRPSSSLWSP